MHNSLIDLARQKSAVKRGGRQVKVTMEDHHAVINAQADELLAINDALGKLTLLDERLGQVVECRFFGGLTEEETGLALEISDRTVRRDWLKARTILYQMLGDQAPEGN